MSCTSTTGWVPKLLSHALLLILSVSFLFLKPGAAQYVNTLVTGLFKAQVAARIGREPHEIMLKRQGERPFKDQLTLEDYGVSNGVQLDL